MVDNTQDSKTNGVESSLVIKLRKSVIANGNEVDELKFREPTAADIERTGNPVTLINLGSLDPNLPHFTFNERAMFQMMALLAEVPPSTIRQMHPIDWNNAAYNLAPFFMPVMWKD